MTEKKLYKQSQEQLTSSLIADGSMANRVFELIKIDDFLDPKYGVIMKAIQNISRKDEIVSVVSVANELTKMGSLSNIGGLPELYTMKAQGEKFLLDGTPELYASIVKESSAKNKISTVIEESKEEFKDDSGTSALDAVSNIQSTLGDIVFGLGDDSHTTDVSEYVNDFMEMIVERKKISDINAENGIDLQGIPTMIPSLNEYTSGWTGGQVITVGARTGIGKSVFAIMSAVAATRAGKSVLFFSLEMGKDEIINRIISLMSGVEINKLKTGRISEEEREKVKKAVEDLSHMKLYIDTDPNATIDSIRSKSFKQAQSDNGLDMIIIDYLQLITPSGKFGSRQEAVSDLSRNTKLTAKVLDVPIMILVQLKRANGEEDEEKLPVVDDIRESGSIGQDSDVVILLHREHSLDGTTPQTLIILAKQRNGPANKIIRCHTNLAYSNFSEVRKNPDLSDENIGDLGDSDLDFTLEGSQDRDSEEMHETLNNSIDDLNDLDFSEFEDDDGTIDF